MSKARHQNETLARDLNQTLSMVTRTEDTSAGRNVQYVERLVDFVDRLESAVRSGDLPRLAAQTSDLRDFAQSIELDSRDDFARLRQKMIEIQRRLHEVELLATLDPLTGVANRRDLDRELAARIEAAPGILRSALRSQRIQGNQRPVRTSLWRRGVEAVSGPPQQPGARPRLCLPLGRR